MSLKICPSFSTEYLPITSCNNPVRTTMTGTWINFTPSGAKRMIKDVLLRRSLTYKAVSPLDTSLQKRGWSYRDQRRKCSFSIYHKSYNPR